MLRKKDNSRGQLLILGMGPMLIKGSQKLGLSIQPAIIIITTIELLTVRQLSSPTKRKLSIEQQEGALDAARKDT